MSGWFVPVVVAGVLLFGLIRRVDVFSAFAEGAKQGIQTAFSILPVLVGLLTVVSMLTASGCIDGLCRLLAPVFGAVGLPAPDIPLALLRPLSGSGALTLLEQLFGSVSPDSTEGLIGSVLVASSETTFYTLTVYFGACGVSRTRYALPSALVGDAVGLVLSVWTVRFFC